MSSAETEPGPARPPLSPESGAKRVSPPAEGGSEDVAADAPVGAQQGAALGAQQGAAEGAAPVPLSVIQQRRDFLLAANRGYRMGLPGLHLQARPRAAEERAQTPARVGYTCSKKVGGAVQRNRAKRRMRAAAAAVLPRLARPGWDYVLIGRRDDTAQRPFEDLKADLEQGLARLHQRADEGAPPPGPPPRKGKGKGGKGGDKGGAKAPAPGAGRR